MQRRCVIQKKFFIIGSISFICAQMRADIPEQQIIMTDQHSGAVLDIITRLISYYSRLHLCLHASST